MMKFIETEQSLTLADLRNFETEHKISLPEDYKTHILRYNGGYPEEETFFKGYPIDGFDSIKYGDQTVEKAIKSLSDVIEGEFLPFGDSLSGVLYMSLNAKDLGSVYVTYSDGQTNFLANSFKEFMNGLSEE